jgi:hypothetical protein
MRDARQVELAGVGPYPADAADLAFGERDGEAREIAVLNRGLLFAEAADVPLPPPEVVLVTTRSRISSAQITWPPSRARP